MPTNRFGFWIDITDDTSAREAIRMAGLPIALIGFNFTLAALMLISDVEARSWIVPSLLAGFGIIFIVLGFLVRGTRGYLVPLASLISIPVLLLQIAFFPTLFSLVPIFALLLSISGLRGWFWLRQAHKG